MKKCTNCFQLKEPDEFYVNRKKTKKGVVGYIGRQSRCKACNAEVCRGYQLRNKLNKGAWDEEENESY